MNLICVCGYSTDRHDNFCRHLRRKKTWCQKMQQDVDVVDNFSLLKWRGIMVFICVDIRDFQLPIQ